MYTTRSWVQILSSHNVSVMNLHDVSVIMTLSPFFDDTSHGLQDLYEDLVYKDIGNEMQ